MVSTKDIVRALIDRGIKQVHTELVLMNDSDDVRRVTNGLVKLVEANSLIASGFLRDIDDNWSYVKDSIRFETSLMNDYDPLEFEIICYYELSEITCQCGRLGKELLSLTHMGTYLQPASVIETGISVPYDELVEVLTYLAVLEHGSIG